jgi:hypothetical protein
MPVESAHLSLVPLGAGDLIDRAVRLYRRHFVTLIRIAAPPVITSAIGSVLWSIGVREMPKANTDWAMYIYFVMAAFGLILLVGGNLFYLIVMGGTARNLVAHLLWNEPVSMRITYSSVRARFWSLLGATIVVTIIISLAALLAMMLWFTMFAIVLMITGVLSLVVPVWIASIIAIVTIVTASIVSGWVFFWLFGRVAYVPQVLLVEGKTVFASINRSSMLAHKNARRLAALVLFGSFATYSALALLAVPLVLYAYLNGFSLIPNVDGQSPIWYEIGYSALTQLSSMLLAPVLMLGLSLLYVDERVRREGYDIELMAASRLGPMPKLADGRTIPFAPALATGNEAKQAFKKDANSSMLDLNN